MSRSDRLGREKKSNYLNHGDGERDRGRDLHGRISIAREGHCLVFYVRHVAGQVSVGAVSRDHFSGHHANQRERTLARGKERFKLSQGFNRIFDSARSVI